jgi:hypothetical protein
MSNPAMSARPTARLRPANGRLTTVNLPKAAPPTAAQPFEALILRLGFLNLAWGRTTSQGGVET